MSGSKVPPMQEVHTTVRQRMRAALRQETKDRYEEFMKQKSPPSRPGSAMSNAKSRWTEQQMDGRVPAINRLMHGEFYAIRGTAIGELGEKKRPETPDAPAKSVSCGVNTEPVHTHVGPHRHHHCHHGHRAFSFSPQTCDECVQAVSGMEYERRPQSRPTYDKQTKSSANKVFAPKPVSQQRKAEIPVPSPKAKHRDPYATALQAAASHPSGVAAVISAQELEKLKKHLQSTPRRDSQLIPQPAEQLRIRELSPQWGTQRAQARRQNYKRQDADQMFF